MSLPTVESNRNELFKKSQLYTNSNNPSPSSSPSSLTPFLQRTLSIGSSIEDSSTRFIFEQNAYTGPSKTPLHKVSSLSSIENRNSLPLNDDEVELAVPSPTLRSPFPKLNPSPKQRTLTHRSLSTNKGLNEKYNLSNLQEPFPTEPSDCNFAKRFSKPNEKGVLLPFNLALPPVDLKGTHCIESWLTLKDPRLAAEKVVNGIMQFPDRELLFLEAFKNVCIKSLKNKKGDDFYNRLISIMAFNEKGPQILISKFFRLFFGNACSDSLKLEKAPIFSIKRFSKEKKEQDSSLFISAQRKKFAKKIFDFYDQRKTFLKLLPEILKADLQDAQEETILRTDYLSTYLANIFFETYLQTPLSEVEKQLEKINLESTVEKKAIGLAECVTFFLEELRKQEFIKVISASIREKILEQFSNSNNKNEMVKHTLTNLIFLRTIFPYFSKSDMKIKKFFSQFLKAICYKNPMVINEMPKIETYESDSITVKKDNERNNKEAEEENPLRIALNKEYASRKDQLSNLLEQALFISK